MMQVRDARWAYQAASARAVKAVGDAREIGLQNPDGAHALHVAIRSERAAIENFHRALKAFNDAVKDSRRNSRQELLGLLLDMAMEATHAAKGLIRARRPANDAFVIVLQRGFDQRDLASLQSFSGETTAWGYALTTRRRTIVEDIAGSSIYEPGLRNVLIASGIRAVQSTPLVSPGGEVVGLLTTHYSRNCPSGHDLHVIDDLAPEAAALLV